MRHDLADWDGKSYAANTGHHRRYDNRFLATLPLRPTDRVLDIGCGAGDLTATVAGLVPEGHVVGLEPQPSLLHEARSRALANQWMDWQLSVVGPAISGAFWGLIRTPPEQRDQAAIAASQAKTIEAMKILDAALGKQPYVAGAAFSMGDVPVGIMAYRFRQLVPDRPALSNFERWYKEISARPAFIEHVSSIPLQ